MIPLFLKDLYLNSFKVGSFIWKVELESFQTTGSFHKRLYQPELDWAKAKSFLQGSHMGSGVQNRVILLNQTLANVVLSMKCCFFISYRF